MPSTAALPADVRVPHATGHHQGHQVCILTVQSPYAESMPHSRRLRFHGHIAGAGTSGGTRLVLGCWSRSPRGPFVDVMVQHPDGLRTLLAPNRWVAEFVSSTYTFEQVLEVPIRLERTGTGTGSRWNVSAGPLTWDFTVGRRSVLGHMLRPIPAPLGRTHTFARISDVVARRLMPGVRTLGSAGNERTEWYAAHDLHDLSESAADWSGTDLGSLTDVDPPAEFGFSSAPAQPSLTKLTSTVRIPWGRERLAVHASPWRNAELRQSWHAA